VKLSSADPSMGALRPIPDARAGSASPARLPVYPRRNGISIGPGRGYGDEQERKFFAAFDSDATW